MTPSTAASGRRSARRSTPATEGSERGREAFIAWSQLWAGYDADNTVKLWDSFDSSPPRVIGAGTVFHLAQQHGWTWPEEPMAFDPDRRTPRPAPNVEVMPPRLSEAALARRFARRHRKQLRFVRNGVSAAGGPAPSGRRTRRRRC